MFEISVFSVILLAAGYWATMFVMGRRDDVIHGKFVHTEDVGDLARHPMPAPLPPFPKHPLRAGSIAGQSPAARAPAAEPVTSEALESLLAAIQRDLKSVA